MAAASWSAICAAYPFPPSYLLISGACSAIFGGRFIILMAAFSYIGDYTDTTHRALNNAIVEGALVIGMHTGAFFGGYSYENLGPSVAFSVAALLHATCLLTVTWTVHDRKYAYASVSSGSGLVDLFSLGNFKESLTMLRKERLGETRFHVGLIITASLISNIAFNGERIVTKIFLYRKQNKKIIKKL